MEIQSIPTPLFPLHTISTHASMSAVKPISLVPLAHPLPNSPIAGLKSLPTLSSHIISPLAQQATQKLAHSAKTPVRFEPDITRLVDTLMQCIGPRFLQIVDLFTLFIEGRIPRLEYHQHVRQLAGTHTYLVNQLVFFLLASAPNAHGPGADTSPAPQGQSTSGQPPSSAKDAQASAPSEPAPGNNKRESGTRREWTIHEDEQFLEGLRQHKTDFRKICKLVPTRSLGQIRSHFHNYAKVIKRVRGGNARAHIRLRGRPTPFASKEIAPVAKQLQEAIAAILDEREGKKP
eukprot:gnl/Trimastix_PCT/582.p1 GENE.gnl/Trimastix_PCT/582~~gnl/Trimastix_PCT/582.p1  ORF type:complete len:290 (+),score=45.90 gnl/Trimastix_PCT/582:107-976(+)